MRIAVVADAFPGLSETFVTDQARALARRGHDVVVIGHVPMAPAAVPDELVGRVRHRRPVPGGVARRVLAMVASLARVALVSPGRAARFARCLAAARRDSPLGLAVWGEPLVAGAPYDAVVCHFGWNARNAALLRPAIDTVVLAAVLHGADLTSWVGDDGPTRFAPVFAEADLLLPVSDRWRRQLLAWGAPDDRVEVQRVGIDLTALEPAERVVGGPVRLLSVARLVEKKGIEAAVRAVAAVEADVRYDVVGDGPLRDDLEELVVALGVGGRVRFLGPQPAAEVRRLLGEADVLLAPSVTAADGDQEGIPVAIMEAMAAGLPVVSTRHSGIPELVEHEVSGLLVAEHDVVALAAAIDALAAAPDRRAELGAVGHRIVAERHDEVVVHDQLERLLSERVGRARGRSAPAAPASRPGS